MPRFLAVVKLSGAALQDLAGSRQRFEQVRHYLARRGVHLNLTFRLDGAYHLFVLEAPDSPTRLLNRALAQVWPEPHERPEHARLISADRWHMDEPRERRPQAAAAVAEAVAGAIAVRGQQQHRVPAAQPSAAARSASYLPSRRARSSLTSRSSRSSSSPR
jgi:hypothetical protein